MLVHEVEELAPLLSAAVLRGVAERMQALVHGTRLREAMASESPLQPEHLSFAAAGGARHICEDGAADGNDGDSVGSLADFEVPAVESEEDQEREEHEQVRVHIDHKGLQLRHTRERVLIDHKRKGLQLRHTRYRPATTTRNTATLLIEKGSVSQSVSDFTVPPRAHPSGTGCPARSPAPPLPV